VRNFFILTEAINYIEDNLCESMTIEQLANHCYLSRYLLEKLFRYAINLSIKDFITRRKISRASADIAKSEMSLMEIAMKYQFNSPEVFSRVFKRVWNISPSKFSEKWKFTNIFPKLNYHYIEGDDMFMARKKVDLTEAYDFFIEHQGTHVLCFDIKNLTFINDISKKAGDLAILEAANRINKYTDENMVMLRIGGDEFALITSYTEISSARQLADNVLSMNTETFKYEGKNIPLSLYCGITTIPETRLKYDLLFNDLHQAIDDSKREYSLKTE